ncbi:MAG: hypothetical protein CMK09_06910 [Ponticaulis sp.]|nr:hypothetical protein [Ponticaulis sp.]|tara:strand:+ start:76610 stop:76807 length:198 start_codon:yes stop_codon:yes gene_type:complete
MPDKTDKPSSRELFIWAVPAFAGLVFTVFALIVHQGVEWGLGFTLFGLLYFLIRYGGRNIETPDQ